MKPIYRYSKLSTFEHCGVAYAKRYVDETPGLGSFFSARGTGMHAGREVNLKQKIKSHIDIGLDIELDAARDAINLQFDEDKINLDTDMLRGKSKRDAAGFVVDSTIPLLRIDRNNLQPDIQPRLVEQDILVEIPALPFDLGGIVDTVTTDNMIIDAKTSKAKWSQANADDSYQPPIYTYLAETFLGEKITGFRFDNLVACKTGARAYTLDTVVTQDRLFAVVERFQAMHEAIEAGVFHPCHKGHWKCNPEWCEYYYDCKFAY